MTSLPNSGHSAESIKKGLRNHGVREPFFGVKIGDMKKIQKRIKKDYQLALDLYDTGLRTGVGRHSLQLKIDIRIDVGGPKVRIRGQPSLVEPFRDSSDDPPSAAMRVEPRKEHPHGRGPRRFSLLESVGDPLQSFGAAF